MKILVFSLAPIFPEAVHGGSQKALRDIAVGLGARGHEVSILCPGREEVGGDFCLSDRVAVNPVLPLKGTFPGPYDVSPFRLGETCRMVSDRLDHADVLYLHDGQLNIEQLKNRIPTVVSLRDFCYPETLLGAINFDQEAVIVNSEYTAQCLADSFAQFNPSLQGKVHVVYNGYDGDAFSSQPLGPDMLALLGLKGKTGKILGFPHRPDLDKGFLEALEVVKELLGRNTQVTLLIPEYMDVGKSSRADNTYRLVRDAIKRASLEEHVVFHDWIPHRLMPQYYAACDAVLCIGNFCEAFSNVAVEALLCETPVVASNSSTYRTMPIRSYIDTADFGDSIATADKVEEVLLRDSSSLIEASRFVRENMSMQKCIDDYERILSEACQQRVRRTKGVFSFRSVSSTTEYHLAPWCYYLKGSIYDDYEHSVYSDALDGMFEGGCQSFTKAEMVGLSLTEDRIEAAIRSGILIPKVSRT